MAKKFNFTLDTVLKLRYQQVEEAKVSLNQAVRIRLEKEENIKQHLQQIDAVRAEKKQHFKADSYQTTENHIKFLSKEINKIKKEVDDILKIERIRKEKLNEAMKNEKILSKLKVKKFDQHKGEILKEENSMMDEIALRRANNSE